MPALKNPRYERFCQGIAKGKSQHDAYVYAGYGSDKEAGADRGNAGKLARKPEVADRIEELLDKQAKRVGITVDALLKELQEMLLLAKRSRQPAAGVGAIMAKGKLLGLVTDKVESETTVRKPAREPTSQTEMSLEDWKKKFTPSSGTMQ